ncbi:Acetyl-coenzyme A synthetase [Rhodopseudomonas palustris]|uniref:Acetyl-CoA synthetase n=1 Tax=Rhodopseudomonas palustris (strain ATCC BAA-98 / CGA009) TaxID=258594 RepID=Q6N1A4_RHOPA|nr:propionyl-CoA synthetase [Rhodopseudomonas palustris]OPF96085.1 propionyl-CoA synthetase [Rhodopseudomonas palustris]QQM06076.1 Acetyl-coenzyme A synthetase [Rhodopseudomonas palustris]RJF66672.1 propionyl-CoA synthetase [Rhodopseudomonas palustris]WAB77395.1 propionyl-CoA synthetase [Rhodopseudomonas palustris]WCL94705.1 propionyl-CoA synthetase [Rhodopseudomonas palustris CGA009]
MTIHDNSRYREVHARSLADPEGFWGEVAKEIDWITPPTKVFDPSLGLYGRWFPGAKVNTCYNALDRHVANGRADQLALIHDSPLTGTVSKYTYAEMLREVQTLAAIMQDFGVQKGDRVILYMPMVPESMVAMLACARIGAVHSVVFGGFAAKELATRIEDAKPKLILSASCGIEPGRIVKYKPLLDEAIELASVKPEACIILKRPQQDCELKAGRDHDWASLREQALAAGKKADCVAVDATDPLYILYTSGTTGKPKGVVRDNGGHLVALKWTMENLYGIKPGEVWWCASDIGWVVGHSYIIYGPLIHGATSIMYEGKPVGTPDAGAFWRVISEHGAVALFTAPTAFRAIRKEDGDGSFIRKYDLSKFRTLFLAGERADPPTVEWAEQQLQVPVIDHWWQTETGWCIAGNPVGLGLLPVKHGSPTVPMPGYKLEVVDEGAKPVPAGTMGSIVIKLPLPPGNLPTLWQQDERCRESYFADFPGYYKTSDAGYVDEDGYVFVMGRTDDIINVAGHRLSTGGMEEILASHPDVAECAVLGINDPIKGEVPCGLIVLKSGVTRDPAEIEKEIVKLVRDKLGPVAAFKLAITVPRLPKTRSGKILRGTIKKIADGDTWTMPATIEDPTALDDISSALKSHS